MAMNSHPESELGPQERPLDGNHRARVDDAGGSANAPADPDSGKAGAGSAADAGAAPLDSWSQPHLSSYLGMQDFGELSRAETTGAAEDSFPGYSVVREIHRG